MVTVAVLGTGLLGSGFVENLLDKNPASADHEVRVWNRTADKTRPLVAAGAVAMDDPATCVRGADRVHLVLAADDAVDSVVELLRPALGAGVPVIDHSTTLPARTRARFDRLRAAGVRYVHAPVFMSPKDARNATGIMLLAAPSADADELRPLLEPMTGKLWYTGERADLAAFYKLAGNGLLIGISGLLGDLLAMGRSLDLSAGEVLGLFDEFQPGAALPFFGQRVATAGDRPASFELQMARKDVGLMLETAGQEAVSVLPAVAQAMDAAIGKGFGKADFAIFARPDRER